MQVPGLHCQLPGLKLKPLSTLKIPEKCQLSHGRKLSAQRKKGKFETLALPESSAAVGADVATTAVASELILRSASQALLPNDGHALSTFLQGLQHAVGSTAFLHAHAHVNETLNVVTSDPTLAGAISQPLMLQPEHLQDVAAAAAPVLLDAATASDTMTAAASVASLSTSAAIDATVSGLAMWAAEKLAVVQSIDPASFQVMQGSLNDVTAAIKETLEYEATAQAMQWTNALVLAVQQLVVTLRAPDGSAGGSVGSMLAAQQAMEEALKNGPGGFNGLVQVTMAVLALIIASIPRGNDLSRNGEGNPGDSLPLRYNVEELSQYFSRRPLAVLQRNAVVVSKLGGFLITILADWRLGQWEQKMPERARTVRKIVEDLGPTYIKIAQAASTRVDMVPTPYLDEFSKLQDNVPTFSTMEARVVLEEGLGQPVDAVFEWLSEEPLAAASLGQVYRGKLRDEYGGTEVAVKVQRPSVLESASLDIFIMRRACVLFSKIPGMSDQWAGVLDDWAQRFFQEMDYQLEAYNTMTFKKQMASLQGIRVATVYPELTSRKIIVSEWIEGERLGDSKAEDVRALCSTLLNCYLIQLLETGLLHADPHPGNLMRTADGKIVILDFGLMTEVTEDQRITLVEFIAHLTMEDWEGVAQDLVGLGFMPEGMPKDAHTKIAPLLQQVMGQIVRGGGLRNGISITGLTSQLEGVARNYKLCIPPYFALVLRAFSVIEGVALKADPDYAIVQECLPYLSRRLLTDNNPRMRAALRQLLYGNSNRLDVERLQRLISAFSAFTTSPNSAESRAMGPTFALAYDEQVKGKRYRSMREEEGPILNEAAKEALKVVFAKDGSYAQELIVEELVAAIDAMSREALSEALRLVMSSATTVAALRSMEALGPLRAMLMPLPLPMEMLYSIEPAVQLTKEDRQALNTIRAVLELLQPSLQQGIPNVAAAGSRAVRAAGEVVPLLPELLPGVQVTVELFFRQLVRRMALRLAEDLEPGKYGSSGSAGGAPSGGVPNSDSDGYYRPPGPAAGRGPSRPAPRR
mmetsp:Transcript_16307/g.35263  ORF Transcript_16307/g.35263 Transcript_16307/m.35263 type:complete len:1034 (+) Transcript_16307:166-3267(+)